jgi:hypothetical protein
MCARLGNYAKTIIQAIQEFKAQKHHFRMMQQQQQQQQQQHMGFNIQANWNGPQQVQQAQSFNSNDMFGDQMFGNFAANHQMQPAQHMFPMQQQQPQPPHMEAFTVL